MRSFIEALPRSVATAVSALALAACSSAAIDVSGTAADPARTSPPVSPGSGVLRPGFDPLSLAPAPEGSAEAHEHGPGHYTCPHHPEVKSDVPGDCPKCGMPLRFVEDPPEAGGAGETPDPHEGHR
jgi:hypothetical protein